MPDFDLMKLFSINGFEEEAVSDFKLDNINEEFKTEKFEEDNRKFYDLEKFKMGKIEKEKIDMSNSTISRKLRPSKR